MNKLKYEPCKYEEVLLQYFFISPKKALMKNSSCCVKKSTLSYKPI